MTLTDLLFVSSFFVFLFMLTRLAVCLLRRRWNSAQGATRWLLGFLCCYASALLVTSTLMPRRVLAAGQRHCFDDWCVAALTAEAAKLPGKWNVTVEVMSEARRVRQRAVDVLAEVEDAYGHRYGPCAAGEATREFSQEVGPGSSFMVRLAFCLPPSAQPVGLVIHHGAFPGALIIGDDQSFLHKPAIARLLVVR